MKTTVKIYEVKVQLLNPEFRQNFEVITFIPISGTGVPETKDSKYVNCSIIPQ